MPFLWIGFGGIAVLLVGMVVKDVLGELVKIAVSYLVGKVRARRKP